MASLETSGWDVGSSGRHKIAGPSAAFDSKKPSAQRLVERRPSLLPGGAWSLHFSRGQSALLWLVPWLIFVLTTCVFIFAFEGFPAIALLLVGLCAAMSVAFLLAGSRGTAGSPLLGIGVWCCASLACAVPFGFTLYQDVAAPYGQLHSGYALSGADPSLPLSDEMLNLDVTEFEFVLGTFVDDKRTAGFVADGRIFCAAPVALAGGPPPERVAFWAVGVGCCEQHSNFDCGAAHSPVATAAVAYFSWEVDNFRHAAELASSLYDLKMQPGARFVHFVANVQHEESAWRSLLIFWCGAAFVTHLVWTLLVCALCKALSKRRRASVDQDLPSWYGGSVQGTVGMEPRPRPLNDLNDPFLRGGGPQPTVNRAALPPTHKTLRSEVAVEIPTTASMPPSAGSEASLKADQIFEEDQQNPIFLSNVVIAPDGGLSEIESMNENLSWWDFLMALMTPCCIIYNIVWTTINDWDDIWHADTKLDSMYLVSTSFFIEPCAHMVAKILRHEDTFQIRAQSLFAICEMTGITFNLLYLIFLAIRLPFVTRFQKWTHVNEIFWEHLPMMSTYSLMSYLGYVVPTVLLTSFQEHCAMVLRDNKITARELGILLRFVLRHVLYAIIGFDAFLVKFRMTARFVTANEMTIWNVLGAGVFVLQLMGVMRMGTLIQRRLFTFVFAGEDCVMDDADEQRMRAYNAMLAHRAWEKSSSWRHFLVIMLNFNDFDFQRLVLNMARTRSLTQESIVSEKEVPKSGFNWAWRPWQSGKKPEVCAPSMQQN